MTPARGEAAEQRDNQMEQHVENTRNTQHGEGSERWPALPYEAWRETCQTLHLWTQIVGKVRMALSPFLNHWWHVTLYVTSRGLTTSSIPYHGGTVSSPTTTAPQQRYGETLSVSLVLCERKGAISRAMEQGLPENLWPGQGWDLHLKQQPLVPSKMHL